MGAEPAKVVMVIGQGEVCGGQMSKGRFPANVVSLRL